MEPLVIALHILICFGIVGLVLLQQGKGAEMGASFGSGGSQTLFGSTGSGNLLSHATAVLATIFFVTSFGLSVLAKNKSAVGADAGIPAAEVIQAVNSATEQQAPVVAPSSGDAPALAPTAPATDVPAAPEKK
jgi:preprotein translocase subunit SecG